MYPAAGKYQCKSPNGQSGLYWEIKCSHAQIDIMICNLKNDKIFLFQCDGCIEKGDYIKRIEDLKPKYVKDEL